VIVWAAIDLRGGRVVQLVGGQPSDERVSLPDPAAIAADWIAQGFRALHLVDLDAALGDGTNEDAIDAILSGARDARVQVGGGIRSTDRVRTLLDAGAAAVVVGTRAIQEPAWLEEIAGCWPGRVTLAADVRGDIVVIRGWTATAGIGIDELLWRTADIPLAAILVTDVSREGSMAGADADRFRTIAERSPHPVLASGGIAGPDDLAALSRAGVAGAVVGMALYTGALDPAAVAKEYA
jgi:phosphoribosylformimino-5-aminoimidazole carboxamide ribotide isomerase